MQEHNNYLINQLNAIPITIHPAPSATQNSQNPKNSENTEKEGKGRGLFEPACRLVIV